MATKKKVVKAHKKQEQVQKVVRPIEFKVRVIALVKEGSTPCQAFEKACTEFNIPKSECMTKYPHSYMWDIRRSVKRHCNDADEKALTLIEQAGLTREQI